MRAVQNPSAAWPDLDGLAGVADAVARAREAIAAVQRLPSNRRGWPKTAAASAIRTARASAMLDGGSAILPSVEEALPATSTAGVDGAGAERARTTGVDRAGAAGVVTDPVLAGALRVSAAVAELSAIWPRAPLQALARLHALAAADLAGSDELGRPSVAAGVGERLSTLAHVVAAAPWSGPVMVAVVHGELLPLAPFGTADGVVARGAARLAMVSTGLDPQALTAPDVGYLRAGEAYRHAAEAFAAGTPEGLADWVQLVCEALRAGAREARSAARAADEYHRSERGHAARHSQAAEHRHT